MDIRPKLYLHIGTHKTGSTAIQKTLSGNRLTLLEKGLIYLPMSSVFKGNKKTIMEGKESNPSAITQGKKNLKHVIKNNKNSDSYVYVMSWEGFSGDPLSGYENADVVAETIKEIFSDFFDVNIIVYLRRQDLFVESLYTQYIHQGESYDFETFIQSISSATFDWKSLLYAYSKKFGKDKVIAKRYEKSSFPAERGILADFCNIIGVDYSALEIESSTPNRDYSPEALEIAKITNPVLNDNQKKYFAGYCKTLAQKNLLIIILIGIIRKGWSFLILILSPILL